MPRRPTRPSPHPRTWSDCRSGSSRPRISSPTSRPRSSGRRRTLSATEPLDLLHLGAPRVIGSYLVETDGGPVLFHCGPTVFIEAVKEGLHYHVLALQDMPHLLLCLNHLDRAPPAAVLLPGRPD